MSSRPLLKILIANRSEIVRRIHATCAVNGIKTVAIYSKEDTFSPFVFETDEAFVLPQSGGGAYLDQEAIINLALRCNADGIHPGYGFLSENAEFARKVGQAGLHWIGPSWELIALMGNKIKARAFMDSINVPIVPGCVISPDETHESLALLAAHIGYPIIIKAACGGGGKAMKVVQDAQNLHNAFAIVKREAYSFFKSTELFLEKYISAGRHIEIQVAGDGTHAVHLFERECSIQRRNQKIIEETPSIFISSATREAMYEHALKAVRESGYNNIGTIEFIVTAAEDFYFLEMNTRLQVEHPVTELTTGIDVIDLQLHIVKTGTLPLQQKEITRRGHAIECRILAEDPDQDFAPSTGVITHLLLPSGPFIRHDHALEIGLEITPFFDSMLSKVISFGQTREQARIAMLDALNHFIVRGITTNNALLKKILLHPDFHHGTFTTQWLSQELARLTSQPSSSPLCSHPALGAALASHHNIKKEQTSLRSTFGAQSPKYNLWKMKQWN